MTRKSAAPGDSGPFQGGDYLGKDFATLLEFPAHCSGIELKPENVEVWDGLSPKPEYPQMPAE
jgi:hypothetical protein